MGCLKNSFLKNINKFQKNTDGGLSLKAAVSVFESV